VKARSTSASWPMQRTKEQGSGAGPGLSTVLRIVKNHEGFIDVYSEPSKGTKFSIYLPAMAVIQIEEAAAATSNMPAGHGEMILVVDDESPVRETARATLESFGYRVLTAQDGTEAIALYVTHKVDVEVILIDMMMPVMDGLATIRALQRINPRLKIIFSSGSARSERVAAAAQLGIKTFLPNLILPRSC
jgi:CheY-like chemotaxis protein